MHQAAQRARPQRPQDPRRLLDDGQAAPADAGRVPCVPFSTRCSLRARAADARVERGCRASQAARSAPTLTTAAQASTVTSARRRRATTAATATTVAEATATAAATATATAEAEAEGTTAGATRATTARRRRLATTAATATTATRATRPAAEEPTSACPSPLKPARPPIARVRADDRPPRLCSDFGRTRRDDDRPNPSSYRSRSPAPRGGDAYGADRGSSSRRSPSPARRRYSPAPRDGDDRREGGGRGRDELDAPPRSADEGGVAVRW